MKKGKNNELEKLGENIPASNPELKILLNNALAQKELNTEVSQLRHAINGTTELLGMTSGTIARAIGGANKGLQDASGAISEAINESTKAINAASEQSTALGKKVVTLNWLLAIVGFIGLLYGGLEVGFKIYDRFYAPPPVKAAAAVKAIPKKAPPKLEKSLPSNQKPEAVKVTQPEPIGKK